LQECFAQLQRSMSTMAETVGSVRGGQPKEVGDTE